ncbi:MAG: hypothetical protein M1818_003767 [Claussenomyces sp. TS43310]|nr:MAG: hypothetical protein M1818_003767 [Claussenomyces sp. TS43310]
MSSNSRPTRTNAAVDGGATAQGEGTQQRSATTLASDWAEPALRAPAPSFKEYPHLYIERHGVLTDMAPLGTMPSSKLRKAAAAATKSDGSKLITMVKKADASAVSSPRESTPEQAVSPVRRRSESRKADDSEWNPRTPVAQTSGRKSAARSSIAGHSTAQRLSSSVSPSPSPSKQDQRVQKTDRVIDAACEQALAANKYPTAYALRSLYNDHRANARIVNLFEQVFHKTADNAQQIEFRTLMTFKKREGMKDGRAKKYFQEHGNTFAAGSLFSHSYSLTTPSKRAARQDSTALASRSSHKAGGHASKRHKSNNYSDKGPFVSNGTPVSEIKLVKMNKAAGDADGHDARSKSVSSNGSSALSSLDEDILREDFAPSVTPTSHSHSHANNNNNSTTAAAIVSEQNHTHAPTLVHDPPGPITASKSLGPKLHAFPTTRKSTTPASSSTPSTTRQVAEGTMPSAYPPPLDSHLHAVVSRPPSSSAAPHNHHVTIKSQKKLAATSAGSSRRLDENDRSVQLRRRAKNITDYTAPIQGSFERGPNLNGREPSSDSEVGGGAGGTNGAVITTTPSVKSGQVLRLRSDRAKRKAQDDFENLSSSTLLSPLPDLGPSSATNSRAGTPNALGRPARKGKTGGLRTKTSPMKNKAGPSAGIPRASGERNSPVGPGHAQDENDDYCSSCGGNGDLVCCDGCTRSFHFKCVDPPMIEGQLPDTWFCNRCNLSRNPPIKESFGSFGELLLDLETRNPSAFHLPKHVREYFEGVRTGGEGEYEEGVVAPKTRHHRSGYDEAADNLRLKDGKGNFILCHQCHQGSITKGPIIPCGYCSLSWHLDCLDPPLANPPPPGRMWRCPCHADDLLLKVPGALGPAHRFRRIKGASVIKPAISRGLRNNGHIEIEFAPSDSDDDDEGFFEQKEFGHVYKLPEEGIKLDFISKCRSAAEAFQPLPYGSIRDRRPSLYDFSTRDVQEQQAALNLAQLVKTVPDGTQTLVDALMTEAPRNLIDMIARGDATHLADIKASTSSPSSTSTSLTRRNKQSLLAIKALIDAQLDRIDAQEQHVVAVKEGGEVQKEEDKAITEESIFDRIVEKAEEEALYDPMDV